MIEQLFFYYMEHIELLPEKYLRMRDAGEQTSVSSAITSPA